MLRFKNDDGSEFPEWEEKNFLDCISKIVDFRGRTPLKLGSDWNEEKSEYLALSALNVKNGYIDDTIDAHYGNEELYNIWMKGNELYKGQVLFTTEAPMGNVAQVPDDKPYILSQRTVAFVPDYTLLQDDFLAVLLSSSNVQKKLDVLATGGTAKGVSQKSLKSLGVKLPSLSEQQKIAEFLSTIDTVIEKQRETVSAWEERKKGVMQKLFSQEVRFKADDGSEFHDWKEKELRDIAVRVTRKNKDNITDIPLTISSADGLIDQRNFFNKVVASKDMSGYYLLKKGEFAYNKSYSKGYDFGSIKRLDLYDEGALSTLYICFALNEDENSDFYQKYFDSLSWYSELQKICAEGARNHGLLNVPTNDFFEIKLYVPVSKQEQQKIADCLSSFDEVIERQKATLAAWEELKKGLLQQMFV